MAAREDIIEKIKHLFEINIKNGSSENETVAAALMAQKLIAKYDIKESELYDTVDMDVIEVESAPAYRKFKYFLAQVIADNYRCRFYLVPVGRKHKICFVGRAIDANAAALIFDKLYNAVNDYANKESLDFRGAGNGLYGRQYNGAAMAFIDGISAELEKQTQELVLVRPKSVDEKYDEITADFSKSRSVCMDSASNVDYAGGVQAGRDAIRATRLNGDSVKKLGR